MKFTKKPIPIEAVRFTGDNWAEMHATTGHFQHHGVPSDVFVEIEEPLDDGLTAEVWNSHHGTWIGVKPGQWIMVGTDSEFYPCEDDGTGTAPLNYEPVEPEPEAQGPSIYKDLLAAMDRPLDGL